MPSDTMPTTLGNYAVEKRLGHGGMGEIFKARHDALKREVAIKRLLPAAQEQEEMVERFAREGQAIAKLRHHNIVAVHDLLLTPESTYMVLEYVDGVDIAELIRNEATLPPDISAIVGAALADALTHAHYHRIIHRDIKPANIMVSKAGEIKLMDFGIARHEQMQGLTSTGMLVGTPLYMAPELILGQKADSRSDIYSLGALLYRVLSGKGLINKNQSMDQVLDTIVNGSYTPLNKVMPDLPKSLVNMIHRAIHPKPEKRYQNAAEFRQDLDVFLATHGVDANHEARVVAYLRDENKISQEEALQALGPQTLAAMSGRKDLHRDDRTPSGTQPRAAMAAATAANSTPRWQRAAIAAGFLVGGIALGGVGSQLAQQNTAEASPSAQPALQARMQPQKTAKPKSQPTQPAALVSIGETALQLASELRFPANGTSLTGKNNQNILDAIAQVMQQNPNLMLHIEAYNSPKDSSQSSSLLPKMRANLVQQALRARQIAPNRLKARGVGQSRVRQSVVFNIFGR